MTSPCHRSARLIALAVVFLLAFCVAARADGDGGATATTHRTRKAVKHTAATRSPSKAHHASTAKAHVSTSRKKSTVRSTRGKTRAIPKSSRARLARLHLQSDRVEEIQQALIGAGYLNGSASGTWDDATRDAMRRYQSENGFSATGLPDAKSLMKLGLGPHPLPADLEPTAAAQVAAPAGKTERN